MADKITNAQQLQDVLDAIYNNREQYDTYQNLTLYYNDISRTATIMAVDDESAELPTKNIIAVFNPENIVTNNNAFFVTLMKSATVNVSTEETSVYDFALGGYVNVDTLLKNICVALGVSLSGTFADANPTLYSDMINIIRNEYGQSLENNAPYIMKKFVNVSTQEETYKSLVPLMCIVRIAIYLNNLGIFNTDELIVLQPQIYSKNLTGFDNSSGLTSLKYFVNEDNKVLPNFFSKQSKNEFITNVRRYFSNITLDLDALQKCLDLYESEITWDDLIVCKWTQTIGSTYEQESFSLYSFSGDTDCFKGSTYVTGDIVNSTRTMITPNGMNTLASYEHNFLYSREGGSASYFTVNVRRENGEVTITNNKTVNVLDSGISDINLLDDYYSNIKRSVKLIPYAFYNRSKNKYYFYNSGSSSSRAYYLNEGMLYIDNNTLHNLTDIHLIKNQNYFIDVLSDLTLKENDIDLNIGDNDIVYNFFLDNGKRKIFIIRDVISFRPGYRNLGMSSQFTGYAYNQIENGSVLTEPFKNIIVPYIDPVNSTASGTTYWLQFDGQKTVDVYDIPYYTYNGDNTYTLGTVTHTQMSLDRYNAIYFNQTTLGETGSTKVFFNNLGEEVEISSESDIEGLTLIEGANYPSGVYDLTSFNNIYPNWFKTQSNNPQIVNGVLAPTVTSTQWGAISISNTTPTEQSDADSGDIDFTDTGLVDDIIDDIDNATEDDDTGGGDTEQSGTNGGEDSGSSPNIEDRTNLPVPAFIKVYALDETKANAFVTEVFSAQTLINDPMQHILGLQVTEMYNEGAGTLEDIVIAGQQLQTQGYKITTIDRYVDINLGEIDIEPYFHNYLDITDTSMQIYLPYIGFIDLDIGDFLDRKIKLECRCDLVSGVILYTIKSIHTDELGVDIKQVKGTYSSNCQYEVPLNATSSLLKTIHNSFAGGGFQRLMASDW